MWAEVNPAPPGMFPGDGDWYVTSIDIAGVNYPMVSGIGPGGAVYIIASFVENYENHLALNIDAAAAPITIPSLHCSFDMFSGNPCSFGCIAPQGTVVTFNWTWTDNGANTVVSSTTLTNSVAYVATTHSTSIDISGIVVPVPPATDADAALDQSNLLHREAAFVDSAGLYSGQVCVEMAEAQYWVFFTHYAKCQLGAQISITHDTSDPADMQISIMNVPSGLLNLDNTYNCGVDQGCNGSDGTVPYVWT